MRRLLSIAVLLIAVVAGACGSDDDPAVEAGSGDDAAASTPEHNDADVEFAQKMIVHHTQAIEMSDMVLENGEDADVKALAEQIKTAQTPEIEIMRGWLEDWGEDEAPAADGGHAGMDMGGDDATMMTDDEMAELEQAEGAELDKMFVEMMIRHHEGAISMAKTEVDDGEFPDAVELAEKIITDQQAEITEMKSLLDKLGS